MIKLIKNGFDKNNIISYGNMFLLANGRFGYRGTLEEYRKDEMVNLTVLGFYDQYKDKWREPINLPNPFFVEVEKSSVLKDEIISHKVELDIKNAVFTRETEFKKSIIKTTRFVSSFDKDLIAEKITIEPKNTDLEISFGVDKLISEINGPHFKSTNYYFDGNKIIFEGITNENKKIVSVNKYIFDSNASKTINNEDKISFITKISKKIELTIFTKVFKNGIVGDFNNSNFDEELEKHKNSFIKKWDMAKVVISGDDNAQDELDYSIYHLLILEDEDSLMSIPARGLSGQTYKGAIFWDTEMFILPFLTLTNPKMAKNTLIYRINTLNGAMQKAKKYGYKGAFYAWESQEDGSERCSEYNITDPITGEPIRTYFNEKQIHISGDITLAIKRYIDFTGDKEFLNEGAFDVIYQCGRFFISYATKEKDGKYHIKDVIGPDEYHERINDNAFTNYLAYFTVKYAYELSDSFKLKFSDSSDDKKIFEDFIENIFLPVPNKDGIIEQFDGYNVLENVLPDEVKCRIKSKNEYLGGENGVVTPTKVIKQADVITLLVTLPELFNNFINERNYKYYLPFTEHGSSLSASMYSICGAKIGDLENSYSLFRKSSGIDLGTNQKMYAGGIYIGGTHPASNAGAYLSVIFGFCGLYLNNGEVCLSQRLPEKIKEIEFKFYFKDKKYVAHVSSEKCKIEEDLL